MIQEPSPPGPFQKWSECDKALRDLKPPYPEESRERFLDRVRDSEKAKNFAFRILCLPFDRVQKRIVELLEEPLIKILGEGKLPVDLGAMETLQNVTCWVREQFSGVRNIEELKHYGSRGDHLWVMLHILRSHHRKPCFIVALRAFAECLSNAGAIAADGTRASERISPADSSWIVKQLRAVVPEKMELPQRAVEFIYALCASAALAESIQERLSNTEAYCREVEDRLKQQKAEIDRLSAQCSELSRAVAQSKAAHHADLDSLKEARSMLERQSGHLITVKREARNEAITNMKSAIHHRLVNIRELADNQHPDGGLIIRMVGEIETSIQRFEGGAGV